MTIAYVPPTYAVDTGKEFDPTTETHHFGFVVKIVDPGCTIEVQIEEASGRVTRVTTTENIFLDHKNIRTAVMAACDRFLAERVQ